MRPRLDFSTDSTLLISSSGSRAATRATRATAENARLPRMRLTGSVPMPLPRWTLPTHGGAGVLGELGERLERLADFAVAVGVDPCPSITDVSGSSTSMATSWAAM